MMAAIVLTASAADARSRYPIHPRHAPYAYGGAYNAYGPRSNAYGARSEEFYGSSVPYDPDGPGWNDFQLQGRT
jgi:hypothetical protein